MKAATLWELHPVTHRVQSRLHAVATAYPLRYVAAAIRHVFFEPALRPF